MKAGTACQLGKTLDVALIAGIACCSAKAPPADEFFAPIAAARQTSNACLESGLFFS